MGYTETIKNSILEYDREKTLAVTQSALQMEVEPLDLLRGITEALKIVGDGFNSGELFLPELIYASDCAQGATKLIEEKIASQGKQTQHKATVVLGTVKGDLHDIGKSIVAALLIANGYKVVDLGTDVSADQMAAAVQDNQAQVLGLSALLTTTAAEMSNVIQAIQSRGLRDQVKIMIGGGATNANYAEKIGADAYGETAVDAVRIVGEMLA